MKMKWLAILGGPLAGLGVVITLMQIYNRPNELNPVPLLLAGIACMGVILIMQLDAIGNAILQIRQQLEDGRE